MTAEIETGAADAEIESAVRDVDKAIDQVTEYANRGTFPDARLQVFATLIHARATLLLVQAQYQMLEELVIQGNKR